MTLNKTVAQLLDSAAVNAERQIEECELRLSIYLSDVASLRAKITELRADVAALRDAENPEPQREVEPKTKMGGEEKAWRRAIVEQVRRHCTPSSEAYARGGDHMVFAVADWIENPPAWAIFEAPQP